MTNAFPLMKCGHTAQGTDGDGNPACVICALVDPRSRIVETERPSLEGRRAFCCYKEGRGNSRPKAHTEGVSSDYGLAFFEYRPDQDTDFFYCGCWGWD